MTNEELFKINAREEIIIKNLPLAKFIAIKFRQKYEKVTFDELYSHAYLSLIEAVDGFDVTKGFKFSTYAYKCIALKMINLIYKDLDLIYIPPEVRIKRKDLLRNKIFIKVAISKKKIIEENTSIDIKDLLNFALNKISKKKSYIIEQYYGLNGVESKDFIEMSKEFGCGIDRIRQLKFTALRQVRKTIKRQLDVIDYRPKRSKSRKTKT